MPKVLLVEDDNNLREIFEMRLQAEGYDTVIASDGEEALSVAMKERPELIVADVMMPKLSGFEMLETLRAAPEMNQVKVIMMTALGQAEDRAKGDKLGVVKYLVKSQVTLEDFVRVVREVMPPENVKSAGSVVAPDGRPSAGQPQSPAPQADPLPPVAGATDSPDPQSQTKQPVQTSAQEKSVIDGQIKSFAAAAAASPMPPADMPTEDSPQPTHEEGPMQTPPPAAPDSTSQAANTTATV